MFERRIRHEGLKSFRTVRASTEGELEAKIRIQNERWAARYRSLKASETADQKGHSSGLSKRDGEMWAFKLNAELEYNLALIQSFLRIVVEAGSTVSASEQPLLSWARQADENTHSNQTNELSPVVFDDFGEDAFGGAEDPMYQDSVRVVLELGKASTSTLQRRLRIGYGRAARILDMMQREGIIGPPDGSAPRAVLRKPDWLNEVESQIQ